MKMNCFKVCCFVQMYMFLHSATGTWSRHWTCSPDSQFQYNVCQDPLHPDDEISTESNICNIDRNYKQNLRIVSYRLKDYVENKKRHFETEFIRCANIVQRLQGDNLSNMIGLEGSGTVTSDNPFTNMFLRMSGFLRLYHKVWCLFGSKAENECCLEFEQIFHTMKHRLLSKWWNVQDRCGEIIDQQNCESQVPSFTNTDLTCEDIRNVIYILLRDARLLLIESQSVIDQI